MIKIIFTSKKLIFIKFIIFLIFLILIYIIIISFDVFSDIFGLSWGIIVANNRSID
jgi:hypothetical protein